MNILDYAPVEFQEHLKALDNTVKFYKVRLRCELESDSDHQASSSLQHYVLTGNEGVGIPEAIGQNIKKHKPLSVFHNFSFYFVPLVSPKLLLFGKT